METDTPFDQAQRTWILDQLLLAGYGDAARFQGLAFTERDLLARLDASAHDDIRRIVGYARSQRFNQE